MPRENLTNKDLQRQEKAKEVAQYLTAYSEKYTNATPPGPDRPPVLGQVINKPNVRRALLPMIVSGILEIDKLLELDQPIKVGTEMTALDERTIADAKEIAARLSPHREGPERIMTIGSHHKIKEDYEANHIHDDLVELATLAMEGLSREYPQTATTASEAVAALRLSAIARTAGQASLQATFTTQNSVPEGGSAA